MKPCIYEPSKNSHKLLRLKWDEPREVYEPQGVSAFTVVAQASEQAPIIESSVTSSATSDSSDLAHPGEYQPVQNEVVEAKW